jgi:choline transport protein
MCLLCVLVRCSGVSLFAITLSGVINFWIPDFVASQWQVYLIYVATGLFTGEKVLVQESSASSNVILTSVPVTPVIFASKHLAWVVQFALWASILGFLLFLFVSTGMHSTVKDSSFLTDSGFGTSGWNSSTAWLLGIANAMYAFGATDGGKITTPSQCLKSESAERELNLFSDSY